jgi:hypothetical protein
MLNGRYAYVHVSARGGGGMLCMQNWIPERGGSTWERGDVIRASNSNISANLKPYAKWHTVMNTGTVQVLWWKKTQERNHDTVPLLRNIQHTRKSEVTNSWPGKENCQLRRILSKTLAPAKEKYVALVHPPPPPHPHPSPHPYLTETRQFRPEEILGRENKYKKYWLALVIFRLHRTPKGK